MATAGRNTDEVLAAARRDLQSQLAVVREELSRLTAEEHALTRALSSLVGDGASSTTAAAADASGRSAGPKRPARPSSAKKAGASRGRRRRGPSKPTADRLSELQGLLADGPKSRNDLATALKVSPARVQQLLAELGSSVSSQRDPEQAQAKLWALTGRGNGAGTEEPSGRRTRGATTGKSPRKPTARRKPAPK